MTATCTGPILLAEDDPDDRLLLTRAFQRCPNAPPLVFVEDGEDTIDYLLGRGRWAQAPPERPGLVVLDLDMPRKDGRAVLAEIKSHPKLRRIPVVVLTGNSAPEEVSRVYGLGANSFVRKPCGFDGLVAVVRALHAWWYGAVTLPGSW